MLPFVLWENIFEDGTITSTSEASGWPDDAIIDWFGMHSTESRWKAGSTSQPQSLTLDLGVGNTASPDTVVIGGHNLFSAGADVVVQWSTDNFSASINNAFTAITPTNDKVIAKTWTAVAARYWRVHITHASSFAVAPQIGIVTLGRRFTFPVGWQEGFDPYGESPKVDRSRNRFGGFLGGNLRYLHKEFEINYPGPGIAVSDLNPSGVKFDTGFIPHARVNPFWYAWDLDTESQHCWLTIRDGDVSTPFFQSTSRRSLNIPCIATLEQ